jgi:hypothetical protein
MNGATLLPTYTFKAWTGKALALSTDYRIRISVFLPFPEEAVDRYCERSLQHSYVGHADNHGEQNGGFVTTDVCEDAALLACVLS